ncbi:hypothetical protein Pmani_034652 [Petrolisthes manimaculis]|nr:hypothetical protein Pmani_034652 [Petrolisthes manimaculis]
MNDLQDATGQVGSVEHIIIHEGYNAITKANDLALLKLSQPLVMEEGKVETLGLPLEGEVLEPDVPCTIVGWGAVTESGGVHDILQKLEVKITSQSACEVVYGAAAIQNGMVCAGQGLAGAGACVGDQGNPLVCSGVLHGVASWGDGCTNSFVPAVYSEVAFFRDWILMQTIQP